MAHLDPDGTSSQPNSREARTPTKRHGPRQPRRSIVSEKYTVPTTDPFMAALSDDDLRPMRGILVGLALGVGFWALMIGVVLAGLALFGGLR